MSLGVFIFGESGRMGQEVRKLIEASQSYHYCGGFNKSGIHWDDKKTPQVVIDFSLPETLPELTKFIHKHQCALVSGTTGYNDSEREKMKALGSVAPVFWSANMSFGVYLMCKLTETLARYENFYQYKIEETHHIHKKDKPSGTALIVHDAAQKNAKNNIPIDAFREGEVFGLHKFVAESQNERLEIIHEAHNRALFAQGALDISTWLSEKKSGFYCMEDFFQSFNGG